MGKGSKSAPGIVVLVFACLLAVGIAACGGSSESKSETGSPDPAAVSGKIVVWDCFDKLFPGYTKAVKPLDEAFERAYPNVTVEHVAQPIESYSQLLRAAFTGHEGPDVMMMIPGKAGVLQYTQGLEELNDRITPEMSEQLTGWYTMTPGFANDGPRYGVPIGATGWNFYYNKKLFVEAGLPREFEPKTWDEVKEAGEKLEAAGIQPFNGGAEDAAEAGVWFNQGWSTVATPEQGIELSEGEISFTDEIVNEALEPLLMVQEAGLYPSDRFTTPFFTEGYERFEGEEGAMSLGGWTSAAFWAEFNPVLGEKNVGIFLPPGSKSVNTSPEYGWSIPSFAKNKEASWAYLEFMSGKEGIEILAKKGGMLPNRKDVGLPSSFPVQAHELVQWTKELEPFPEATQLVTSTVGETLNKELNQVLQGRLSLDAALESVQEVAEKED
ncbi:MAG TPA: extracellular solute-binding protein [Solirubrobacterales bacterium]|nr:extracellular solute-binding protein [Solirubrobacterales bacterium]